MSELLLHFWLGTWEGNTTKKRKQNSTCAKWWLMCFSVWVCWWWGLGVDGYLGSCSGACGLNKKGQAVFPSTAPRHVFKHFISNYFPNLLKTTKYLEPPFRWWILKPPFCCRKHSSDSWNLGCWPLLNTLQILYIIFICSLLHPPHLPLRV